MEVEAGIQRPGIAATPAESIACRAEGFAGVHSHDCLGNHVGNRLVRQNVIIDGAGNAKSQHRHVYVNRGFPDFLAGFSALAGKSSQLCMMVAVSIFGVNAEIVLFFVPDLRDRRNQIIFPIAICANAFRWNPLYHCLCVLIQKLNCNEFVCARRRNIADLISVRILAPSLHFQVIDGSARDFLSLIRAQKINYHIVSASGLVGNIDFEGILISRVVVRLDREIILTGFFVIQIKPNRLRFATC